MGFVSAVQWGEPWIIGLGVFHVVLLIAAVATRKNSNVQIALFGFILGLVYFAETLNGLGVRVHAPEHALAQKLVEIN